MPVVYIRQTIGVLACLMDPDLYAPWSVISNPAVSQTNITKVSQNEIKKIYFQNVSYNNNLIFNLFN